MYIDNTLTHAYVIHEMMIRTLERDLKYLSGLKTEQVIAKWYDKTIKQARTELVEIKKQMAAKGIFYQSEYKIDDQFTGFSFTFHGAAHQMRYANYALRNHTLIELERILGI